MSNSRIEDKLLKDVSYRKKPKQLYSNKSNTWSSPSVKHQLNNPSNKLDITDFSSNNNQILPIEERIKIYEAKYMQCLNSKTQLLVWIKSTKEKGPPKPLTEGHYTPPVRSRLPDFFFSSLSTKPRRKSNCEPVAPTAKSSLSTFLKKATDSLSTTYKQVPPLKRQQKIPKSPTSTTCTTTTTHASSNHRFSLTSSLNRFSLAKTSHHNIKLEAASKPSCTRIETNTNKEPTKTKSNNRYKRFSTPPPEKKSTSSACADIVCPKPTHERQNLGSLNKQKPRPQSTILPHSPSSVFLDRLRSRVPGNDTIGGDDDQTIQSNISSGKPILNYAWLQNSTSSIGIADDDFTPPSSPSSIDSVSTSPSITTPPSLLVPVTSSSTSTRHRRSQDFFFLGKHKSSLLSAAEKKGFLVSDVIVEDEQEDAFIRDHSLKSDPLQQQKKKRASLLIAPSLSSIRLLSQKSQFLRRQSMLT